MQAGEWASERSSLRTAHTSISGNGKLARWKTHCYKHLSPLPPLRSLYAQLAGLDKREEYREAKYLAL
jgi:hypothetical protein